MKRTPVGLSQLIAVLLVLALTALPISAEETPEPVNINEASAEVLAEHLSGIGPTKAEAIVSFRETEGDFVTVEHLEEVRGIGIATIENNRDRIRVE